MSLRFVFTKGITMCKPAIVKEREKNVKKLAMKNVTTSETLIQTLQTKTEPHYNQINMCSEIFKVVY